MENEIARLEPKMRSHIAALTSTQGQLSLLSSSRLRLQPQSPLFQLPREIRDLIWAFVVACGEVHLSRPTSRSPLQISRLYESQPQILAACCQLIYYTKNTFFLPYRAAQNTVDFFDIIRGEHQALINSIAIEYSCAEIEASLSESQIRETEVIFKQERWGMKVMELLSEPSIAMPITLNSMFEDNTIAHFPREVDPQDDYWQAADSICYFVSTQVKVLRSRCEMKDSRPEQKRLLEEELSGRKWNGLDPEDCL